MFYAGRVGLSQVMRRMKEFASNEHADPPSWKPAALIERLAAGGKTFDNPPAARAKTTKRRSP
jgi:hypothetical protein